MIVYRKACVIPRQRILHHRETHDLPADFAQRLKRFQEESGLSWSEIARRLGTYPHTVWLWKEGKSRPNPQHQKALVQLAESMGLGHLFIGPPGRLKIDLRPATLRRARHN